MIDIQRVEKFEENIRTYYCMECHHRHRKMSSVGMFHYGKRFRPSDEYIVAKLKAKSHDGKMLLSEAYEIVGKSTVDRLSKVGEDRGKLLFLVRRTRGGAYIEF